MIETKRISVVVACRNEIRHIRSFLDSLLSQELGDLQMEVVIADGMSIDGTRAVLFEHRRKFPSIRILDNPERVASTGLNRAIREARGEIILRMDAHSLYAPDYVRSCVAALLETGAQNVGGPARTRADGYWGGAIAAAFHSAFACGSARFRDECYEGFVRSVPYGCWRKESLVRIGLFDRDLVRGQDDELNYRITAAGGRVWQTPRIRSWYRPRSNLTALARQFFQNGYWKVAAIKKHGRPPSWRNLVPAVCLVAGAGLPLAGAAIGKAGLSGAERAFFEVWVTLVCLYAAASLASASGTAARRGWRYLPVLPVVFATYQISYALGFLAALLFRLGGASCGGIRKTRLAANR